MKITLDGLTLTFDQQNSELAKIHYNHLTKTWHSDEEAKKAYYEFFGAFIRNRNTRIAYLYAVRDFFDWSEDYGVFEAHEAEPVHVAKWLDEQLKYKSVPTMKQRLAALKVSFDWLVTKQLLSRNPASSVRAPKYSVRTGKTPHLSSEEARKLLDNIDISNAKGLRDRALIALMTYTFARVGAALNLRQEDVFYQEGRMWVRLREKSGRTNDLPYHHNLDWMKEFLLYSAKNGSVIPFVFVSIDRNTKQLSDRPMNQSNAYQMVRKRAIEAGINTKVCNHTFRATGITAFLENSGTLERAAHIANHASTRTTQLYDRRNRKILLRDVEKVDV